MRNGIILIITVLLISSISCSSGRIDADTDPVWIKYWYEFNTFDAWIGIDEAGGIYVAGSDATNACSDLDSMNTERSSFFAVNYFSSDGRFIRSIQLRNTQFKVHVSGNQAFIYAACDPMGEITLADTVIIQNDTEITQNYLLRIDSGGNYSVNNIQLEGVNLQYCSYMDSVSPSEIYLAVGVRRTDRLIESHCDHSGTGSVIIKIDSDGNIIDYFNLESILVDQIEIDTGSNIYLKGDFIASSDFDPSDDVYSLETYTERDFIARYDPDYTLLWVKPDLGCDLIDSDSDGNLYTMRERGNFTIYSPDGDIINSVSLLATISDLRIFGDRTFICGKFNGTVDFDPTDGGHLMTAVGRPAGFYLILDIDGNFIDAGSYGNLNSITQVHRIVECNDEIILYGQRGNTSFLMKMDEED